MRQNETEWSKEKEEKENKWLNEWQHTTYSGRRKRERDMDRDQLERSVSHDTLILALFLPSSPFSPFFLFSLFFSCQIALHTLNVSQPSEYTEQTIWYSHFSLFFRWFGVRAKHLQSAGRRKRENQAESSMMLGAWWLFKVFFLLTSLLSCRHGIVCLFLHHFTFSSHRHRHFSFSLSASQSLKSKSLLMTSERYDFLLLFKKKRRQWVKDLTSSCSEVVMEGMSERARKETYRMKQHNIKCTRQRDR